MWTRRRSGTRLLGPLALACLALAGAALLVLAAASPARAQQGPDGAYMGVVLQEMDAGLRDSYEYRGPGGVLIGSVESGSPADKAGARRGDILIRFDGRTPHSPADLTQWVRARKRGDRVSVSVWRKGRERTLHVTLGARPVVVREYEEEVAEGVGPDEPEPPRIVWRDEGSDEEIAIPLPGKEIERMVRVVTGKPRLGVEMQDLNPELGAYFGRPEGRGVLVTRVQKETPAEKAGVKVGDVIVEIDGEAVDDGAALRRRLDDKDAGPVRIAVMRRGERQVLTAQLEERETMSWSGPAPRIRLRGLGPELRPEPRRELRRELRLEPRQEPRPELRRQMDDLQREMKKLERELESLRERMGEEGAGKK